LERNDFQNYEFVLSTGRAYRSRVGAMRGRNDLSKGVRSMNKTKKSQVMDGESAYAALKARAEGCRWTWWARLAA
jgi:hypothetical protein